MKHSIKSQKISPREPRRHIVRRALLDGLFILLGSAAYALSVNVFTAPNRIAPGGVTGVATLVNYLT